MEYSATHIYCGQHLRENIFFVPAIFISDIAGPTLIPMGDAVTFDSYGSIVLPS